MVYILYCTPTHLNNMAKFVKGAVRQLRENKRRRTTHPEAQFMTDVGGIAIAKGIRKLFGFGRRSRHRRGRTHQFRHPHALYNSVPSNYRDELTSKPIRSAVLYGTSMNNSHSLPEVRKPHIENYVHGMGRLHANRALHAEKKRTFSEGGMGTRNTTQLIFRPSQHHSMPRAGAGEFSNAYNRSYKSRLAHDVVVDRNPALASAAMLADPLKFTRAKALSARYLSPGIKKRMSVGNYANARAFVKVNPHMSHKLRTTWYANTAGITNL